MRAAVALLLLVQGSYFIGTDGRRYWSPLDVPNVKPAPKPHPQSAPRRNARESGFVCDPRCRMPLRTQK